MKAFLRKLYVTRRVSYIYISKFKQETDDLYQAGKLTMLNRLFSTFCYRSLRYW